ncbi:MAG TPA: FKBP-type peptidyl-prolyl cis-trans isomerase [Polyangia bacterium]|jgi:FKBP-type peptidyl-prolyl cis-trans isomerase FkpA|nr:FKBP-type peptidyl-prolyl cis-trans isomerase [Polyangia bacterium]
MMKPALFLGLLTLALPACNKMNGGGGGSVKLDSDDQKTLYALGLIIGRNVANFNLSPSELETVKAGISDAALAKKPQVELEVYGPKVNQFGRKRSEAKAADEKKKGQEFADKAAQEAGAERLSSGAVYKMISPGTGASPKDTDTVKVNYRGTLTNGTEFDSSYKRNEPATFPLHNVIPCWTEGLQKMKVGEKARLVCPSNIAYGDQGRPPTIPGGSTLVFEVELVDIVKAQTPVPGQTLVPPSGMKMAPGAHFGAPPPGMRLAPGGMHLPPPGAKPAPASK